VDCRDFGEKEKGLVGIEEKWGSGLGSGEHLKEIKVVGLRLLIGNEWKTLNKLVYCLKELVIVKGERL
jgi:hypothetical protein